MYFFLWFRQTKCMINDDQGGSTKLVNFIKPKAGVLVLGAWPYQSYSENALCFLNLLYSQAQIRQTKYIVMMTKEGSTKIVNIIIPGAGVLVLGRGLIMSPKCIFS